MISVREEPPFGVTMMMRARLHGNPCRVEGHGSRCERVDDRDVVDRAQEKRQWQREAIKEARCG